jgi:GNAT superfamily N-acetyltransferase
VPVVVESVPAAATYPLRQRVLRPKRPKTDVTWAEDNDELAAHFAARDTRTGAIVGTASVWPEDPPWPTDRLVAEGAVPDRVRHWRLRGMATEQRLRGQGIGTQLLDTLIAYVAAHGGGLLWCNARVPAKGLYERGGFRQEGEPWVDAEIGPHVVMWRTVGPATPDSPAPADG